MKGFIILNREILDWEWYDNINVKSLFIHCLLKANFKQKSWRGIKIKRGSFVTSVAKLSAELEQTPQQTRTALKNLQTTNEITIKTTNRNSMITIVSYDKYQSIQQTDNKQITNKQQTDNKQITTTNNDNNNNNDNKETILNKMSAKKELVNRVNKNFLLSDLKKSDVSLKYLSLIKNHSKEDIKIALMFQNLFLENIKSVGGVTKKVENAKSYIWVDPIRKLIKIDKIKKNQFREVYDYLKISEFWKPNILSTAKLREKFNELLLNSKKEKNKKHGKSKGTTKATAAGIKNIINDY